MAKLLRKLAPGYSDLQPAGDWCEVIFADQRNEPMGTKSEVYGAACQRWCVPGGAGYLPRNDSDWGRPKHLIWDVWGPGASGWGSCCCMGGAPAGGGAHQRECHDAIRGDTYCLNIGFGACCKPADSPKACNSCLRSMATCCSMLVSGGNCGVASCYYDYCCHQGTGGAQPNRGPGNFPYRHSNKSGNCSCHSLGGLETYPVCVFASGMEKGRQPYNASNRNCGGKNCIPIGQCKPLPGGDVTSACKDITMGDNCSASGECGKRYHQEMFKFGMSFDTNSCHDGCSDWVCGTQKWVRMQYNDPTHVTSGGSYINMTATAARAWGGWNWGNWMHCSLGGTTDNNCSMNLRMIGMGGAPAKVCGGPCCCGGPGTNGAIIVKYR